MKIASRNLIFLAMLSITSLWHPYDSLTATVSATHTQPLRLQTTLNYSRERQHAQLVFKKNSPAERKILRCNSFPDIIGIWSKSAQRPFSSCNGSDAIERSKEREMKKKRRRKGKERKVRRINRDQSLSKRIRRRNETRPVGNISTHTHTTGTSQTSALVDAVVV